MKLLLPLVITALITTAGCEERKASESRSSPAPTSETAPAPSRPTPDELKDWQPTHPAPKYTLDIEKSDTDPPTYSVVWTATVDSGGWRMTTESVLVEENNRSIEARVYIVLHEPPPGEAVTVSPEVLTGRHDNKTEVIHLAELTAKHTVRDSNPTFPQLFTVVQRAGEPSGE